LSAKWLGPRALGYVHALIALVVAVGLTYSVSYAIGGKYRGSFLFFLMALMVAAWNGYGPGLALLAATVLLRRFTVSQIDFTSVGLLFLISLLVSRISATSSHVEEALRKSNEDLDNRVRQRTGELQQANQALQASEGRFSFFMRNLPGAAWMKDLAGRYIYVNPTGERIFGRTLDQLQGKTDEEIFPLDVAAQFRENDRRALMDPGGLETIETLPQEDGLHYSMVKKFAILDGDAKPMMVGGIAIDVTARRKAEEEAFNRLAELEHLYRSAPVGLALMDMELRYVRLNGRLAEINGVPAADHIGRGVREILPAGLADAVEPAQRHVLETGEPILNLEVHGATRSGAERDWLVSYTPVRNEEGVVFGVQALVQDITERKQFDEQLRHTAKLESLGILAGGVAHDFNNLLTGILGNASLAQEVAPADAGLQRMLQDVIEAGERASHLTRQLLAYAGKGQFVIEQIDLSQMARDIHPLMRTSIPKNANLRLELKDSPPLVSADGSQMQQLMMNLVINGGEAIPPDKTGEVLVRIDDLVVNEEYLRSARFVAAAGLTPGHYVRLSVRDTGAGMDGPTQKRIFDPFFTTKFTGRGLGLAAVMGIVLGHSGGLALASAPGGGSTFEILLPVAARTAAANPAQPRATGGMTGGSVLIIDDEEIVRRTARASLERHGFTVFEAASGSVGIEIFRDSPIRIDVVILDLTMPGLSGEETFARLKRIRSDARVLLSSGYDEIETLRRFDGRRPAGFIQKPYSSAALMSKVNSALEARADMTEA
jgi:PAS domain S-box-containing protein